MSSLFGCPPSLRLSPSAFVPNFSMLSHRLCEGLRALEGCVVGTLSTPEANDPQEDLVVHRSDPGKVLRSEGPRHTSVQQGLNQLGLQHADVQIKRGRLHAPLKPLAELFAVSVHCFSSMETLTTKRHV